MTRAKPRLIWLAVGAFLTVVIGANVHLVYVAYASRPECVAHARTGALPMPGSFSAAKSSC
jgi:hypothetical protein